MVFGLQKQSKMSDFAHQNCEEWKTNALRKNKVVQKILSKIESTNFNFRESCISCEHCPDGLRGGLTTAPEILLCENMLKTQSDVEQVLSHELVHFLDHLKGTKWDNVHELARSEVRAAKFSLECHSEASQFYEGCLEQPHLCSISEQFKKCVKNRAIDSVKMIKDDMTHSKARTVVESVFDKSFNEDL